jgi:DNA-binding transcriptional ArsR family regulator
MRELEQIAKAVANKRRLKILSYLKKGRASVSDVAEAIKLSFKATSRHLSILTNAGIVEKHQEGLVMWHSLAKVQHPAMVTLLKHL